MAECECLPVCPFFHDRLKAMPAMVDIYKHNYCLGNFESCARHLVFSKLGPGSAPETLWPNQMDDAKRFLAEKGVSA
jgi:hypothetical protein